MKNPFKKFGQAVKVGYKVLQKYEQLEQAGLVPTLTIKNIPVHVIDGAANAFVKTVKDAHDAPKSTSPDAA